MNARNLFRRHFQFSIVSQKAVNLLLHIGKLSVAKTSQKSQAGDAAHQVAILFQQFIGGVEGSVELVKLVALFRRDVLRFLEEATHLG